MKNFWRESLKEYEFTSDGLEVLRMACHSLERFLQAKDILDKEGIVFKTKNGYKKHPAAEIEKTARQGFLQACKQLGISTDTEKGTVGRPWGREGI